MKTLLLFKTAVVASAFLLCAFTSPDAALLEWRKVSHDFGEIVKDVPASAEFELENLGSEPILITRVKGSCGCTATSYDKDPIQPGKSASVKATYNAKATGPFTKTVTVYTNAQDEPFVLTVKGTVVDE